MSSNLRVDHFVLTVASVEETCRFYEQVLGMEAVTFGERRIALKFGNQKINLHPEDEVILPRAHNPQRGGGDFCLVTDGSLEPILERLKAADIDVEEGPVERTGAVGPIMSIYIRDPDQNLIEISTYDF